MDAVRLDVAEALGGVGEEGGPGEHAFDVDAVVLDGEGFEVYRVNAEGACLLVHVDLSDLGLPFLR